MAKAVKATTVALLPLVVVMLVMLVAESQGNRHADIIELEDCDVIYPLPLEVKLNNGLKVPRIGFGTAGLGPATEASVFEALAAGYRHIDTAQAAEWYDEGAVGRAVERATAGSPPSSKASPDDASGSPPGVEAASSSEESYEASWMEAVPREEIFVTTKIHPRDFGPEKIGLAATASMTTLQGVDLLLLHAPHCWPGACPENPTPWQDAWRELEKFYREGAVQAIGVSNFSANLLRELLEMAVVTPAAVQNWMDPFHQDREVRALCSENGIAYMAYSTLGGQWAYRKTAASGTNPVLTDVTLGRIAENYGTSRQAVVLSWALQSGAMILPRSSNPSNIWQNVQGFVTFEEGCEDLLDGGVATASSWSSGGESGEGSAATISIGVGECEEVHGGAAAIRYGRSRVAVILTAHDMIKIDRLDGIFGA